MRESEDSDVELLGGHELLENAVPNSGRDFDDPFTYESREEMLAYEKSLWDRLDDPTS